MRVLSKASHLLGILHRIHCGRGLHHYITKMNAEGARPCYFAVSPSRVYGVYELLSICRNLEVWASIHG